MNTSNKTLLQILTEELPKRGGWPSMAKRIHQDHDGETWGWGSGDAGPDLLFTIEQVAVNARKHGEDETYENMVTREQYEAALEASKEPLTGTGVDGWIDWPGGECPVPRGTLVDVRYRNGSELFGLPADESVRNSPNAHQAYWDNDDNPRDIIAYRLHPHQLLEQANSKGPLTQADFAQAGITEQDDESDLDECIGQAQSNDQARDEILYELANFAASTCTSLDIGAATQIAMWLSEKGYRKQ